jgi:alpha-tubulin suppressor-like RCC1 family protein
MNRRYTLFCLAFLCAVTLAHAQGTLVTIRLSQPPPNQVRIADLWRVELNNRSGRDVRVYLHGTAEELSIPDGLIVEAFTKVITLPPGITRLTGNEVQPIRTQNENRKYRDVLLSTGSAPTGEYRICCEVIEAATDQVLGLDCKNITVNRMTIPVLIAPADESEVPDKLPVFSWMPSVPPGPGQRISYELRMAEMFGRQTAQDAIVRNPLHLKLENLLRTVIQYPISARELEPGKRYAWMVVAWEDRGSARVNLGESEIWWFTHQPSVSQERGTGNDDETAKRGDGRNVPPKPAGCQGENWDFELGTLECWTPDGDAWFDQPIKGPHSVLGDLGNHREWWVTSYATAIGDKARGTLESEEIQLRTSAVGFLAGGDLASDVAVELLIEKQPKDTFKLETRKIAGSPKEYWLAATTAQASRRGRAVAGMSERLVPVEWDVRPFMNRAARIVIADRSTVGHINVDHFRFYDLEKSDTIKQPVLAMAAGELHSLAVTPEKKPSKNDWVKGGKDALDVKNRQTKVESITVVNETTMNLKGNISAFLTQQQNVGLQAQTVGTPKKTDDAQESNLLGVTLQPQAMKVYEQLIVAMKNQPTVVWGWGGNLARQIGGAAAAAVPQPRLMPPLKNIEALAAGMAHSLFVDRERKLYSVGLNDYYQLGLGTENRGFIGTPTAAKTTIELIAVAAGHRHSLGLTKEGRIVAWGYNGNGELGLGVTRSEDATTGQLKNILHVAVPFPHSVKSKPPTYYAIAAGGSHSAALDVNGRVWCWGVNHYGQCGRNDDTTMFDAPVRVDLPLTLGATTNVSKSQPMMPVAIACGDVHTMALMSDGTVRAWGSNASGQLGDGTTKDSHKPVTVKGLGGIQAIAAGGTFSLALDTAGVVWAWGNNGVGQLGTGDRISRFTPVQVERLDAITGIVAGGAHAMAVRRDGSLWTWGLQNAGQLGEGAVVNLTPVPADSPRLPMRVEKLAVAP